MFWKRKPAEPAPIIIDASITLAPGERLLLFMDHKTLSVENFERIKAMFPENEVTVFGADWRAAVLERVF